MARPLPPLALTLSLALAAHWWLWPYNGADIATFLIPWFDHIRATGPVAVFAEPFANYAPLYLYLLSGATLFAEWVDTITLIKLVSVAGTIALTGAMWHLLHAWGSGDRALPGAALVLILPSTLINAALMGQCDAMWAAACVMAIACAHRRNHAAMLAWCGLALGFKLQAAFFGPFVLALLIHRRVPFRLWFAAPAVWVATLLPAWVAGWPAFDLATIYMRQADYDPSLALNAPNLWMIVDAYPALDAIPLGGLALAAALGATAAYVAWFSVTPLHGRALANAALLAPLIVVGLLPRMHERYFFLADILSLAIALAWPDRRSWTVAALVQAGSVFGLFAYMSGIGGLAAIGAVPMIAATIMVARALLTRAANDNPMLARRV
ncbi:hypothetical protein M0208_04285 [Sphingomonas sp. SUN019]|uniref:hypothetical protein n=1 Tax=Sphingomonas sp. SUN019 TaxID=2937788 RepID=UPI0021643FE2|nr:hypothetical protein [Sphingomonas sp. SUN019]UVO49770.1 hypothetical protein M0208_04285 [Sphingomonas sp. SUN019]